MSRLKIFLAVFALILSSLACTTLLGEEESYSEEESVFVPDEPQTQNLPPQGQSISCPLLTDKILESAQFVGESESEGWDEEIVLVTYGVTGDEIYDPYFEDVTSDLQDEQNDESAHQQVWNLYTSLIPQQDRWMLVEYSIITDGVDNVLAAVTQTAYDPNSWALQVDVADINDGNNLVFTLIHEHGHLLTLNANQVPPSLAVFNNPEDDTVYFKEVSACPNYFPGEGCANANSYIDDFYNQFWLELHDEWNEINLIEDDDEYYEQLDEFYFRYEDRFVTDYAATNPEEDIAETWTFFVLSQKPEGDTIAEQKILFFYQYPELVQLREDIIGRLCMISP